MAEDCLITEISSFNYISRILEFPDNPCSERLISVSISLRQLAASLMTLTMVWTLNLISYSWVLNPSTFSMTNSGRASASSLMQLITSMPVFTLILVVSGTKNPYWSLAPSEPRPTLRWSFLTRLSATVIPKTLPKSLSLCVPSETSRLWSSIALSGAEMLSTTSSLIHQTMLLCTLKNLTSL